MSRTLYWKETTPRNFKGCSKHPKLMDVLLPGNQPRILVHGDLLYLYGLKDAGIDEVSEIIEHLEAERYELKEILVKALADNGVQREELAALKSAPSVKGWLLMDEGSLEIIAERNGIIELKPDGYFHESFPKEWIHRAEIRLIEEEEK